MRADILIVDNEADIRELVSGILQDEGYATCAAPNSDDALASVVACRPNLVFLDIWMQNSRLDGLQLLDLLKVGHPDLPIVMISGHGNAETAVSAIKRGAYEFIEKPFKSDRLLLVANVHWKIPASIGAHRGCLMRGTINNHELSSTLMKSGSKGPRYTNLFACISEEEKDSYIVRVRLYNQVSPESAAWGEEEANSFEMASMMVSALAAEFSIAQAQIKIAIRMREPKSGTRH